jgi:hypothetical protein
MNTAQTRPPSGLAARLASLLFTVLAALAAAPAAAEEHTYGPEEVLAEAKRLFGDATEGLGEVVEKVFADKGRPNAYIAGEEVSGAIGVGVTYGEGTLRFKRGASRKVYWQGPSIGFDLGGNASKVFVLVYDLPSTDALFQRFPGVDGSFYYVGGAGVNYQRSGDIVLAPIRAGVGLRARASVGYMHYTRKKSWIPF